MKEGTKVRFKYPGKYVGCDISLKDLKDVVFTVGAARGNNTQLHCPTKDYHVWVTTGGMVTALEIVYDPTEEQKRFISKRSSCNNVIAHFMEANYDKYELMQPIISDGTGYYAVFMQLRERKKIDQYA